MKQAISTTDSDLTTDDMDMLQQVLEHVRGTYPDEPYRQADFDAEAFELDLEIEG